MTSTLGNFMIKATHIGFTAGAYTFFNDALLGNQNMWKKCVKVLNPSHLVENGTQVISYLKPSALFSSAKDGLGCIYEAQLPSLANIVSYLTSKSLHERVTHSDLPMKVLMGAGVGVLCFISYTTLNKLPLVNRLGMANTVVAMAVPAAIAFYAAHPTASSEQLAALSLMLVTTRLAAGAMISGFKLACKVGCKAAEVARIVFVPSFASTKVKETGNLTGKEAGKAAEAAQQSLDSFSTQSNQTPTKTHKKKNRDEQKTNPDSLPGRPPAGSPAAPPFRTPTRSPSKGGSSRVGAPVVEGL